MADEQVPKAIAELQQDIRELRTRVENIVDKLDKHCESEAVLVDVRILLTKIDTSFGAASKDIEELKERVKVLEDKPGKTLWLIYSTVIATVINVLSRLIK